MGYSFKNVCTNVIPAGTYKAQITDIKFKTSTTATESYNMQVTYTIIEGPYAKKTVIDTLYENAFSFRLMPFLKACDVDVAKEFASTKELYNYGIREAKGKIVMIELTTKEYNGQMYNNVKTWAHIPGSSTSESEVLQEFNDDELTPEVAPAKPTVADVAEPETTDEPKLDINLDDIDID